MKKVLTVLALALFALVAAAQTSLTNVVGEVVAVDAAAKTIFVKSDAGAVVIVSVSDTTKILKNPPGEKGLTKATPMSLADIGAGDRILARGASSTDGKTMPSAVAVVINTKAEVNAMHEAERAEWRARGIVGVVAAVNPETKEITIQTRTAEGPKPVVIAAGGANVKLRRYAPDSIKFADAKTAPFEEVKAGDQLRAKGDKSEDGTHFTPDEVVTGTFRTALGTVKAVDAAKNEITIEQAQDKKPLTVVVRPDSVLKQLAPEVIAMMAGGGMPGGGGAGAGQGGAGGGGGQRVVVQQGAPGGGQAASTAGAGQGAAQGQGQGAGQGQGQGGGPRRMMGGGDMMQQMLERMPPVTLAEIKPGQMIVVSSTVGADPTRVTAIQLLSNIEPLVAMMSRRPGGAGGPGGMGGGAAAGGGGGFNFGFGIGQP
jgi:hypothetical protein